MRSRKERGYLPSNWERERLATENIAEEKQVSLDRVRRKPWKGYGLRRRVSGKEKRVRKKARRGEAFGLPGHLKAGKDKAEGISQERGERKI